MVNTRNRYLTSRDYDRLHYLLDRGLDIICFVYFRCDGTDYHDVCVARFVPRENKEFEHYSFSSRGIEYFRYNKQNERYRWYPKSFNEMMHRHDVEFIDVKE